MKRSLSQQSFPLKMSKTPRNLLMDNGVDVNVLHADYAEQNLLLEKIKLLEALNDNNNNNKDKLSSWVKVISGIPFSLSTSETTYTTRCSPSGLMIIGKDCTDSSLSCFKLDLSSPNDSEEHAIKIVNPWKADWQIICVSSIDPYIVVVYIDSTSSLFACRFNTETKLEAQHLLLGALTGVHKKNNKRWKIYGVFVKETKLAVLITSKYLIFDFTPALEPITAQSALGSQNQRVSHPSQDLFNSLSTQNLQSLAIHPSSIDKRVFGDPASSSSSSSSSYSSSSSQQTHSTNTMYFFNESNTVMTIPTWKYLDTDTANNWKSNVDYAKLFHLEAGQPNLSLNKMIPTDEKLLVISGLREDDYSRLFICRSSPFTEKSSSQQTFLGSVNTREQIRFTEVDTIGPRPRGKDVISTVFVSHSSVQGLGEVGKGCELDRVVVFSRVKSEENPKLHELDIYCLTLAGKADTRANLIKMRNELMTRSEKIEDRNIDILLKGLWNEISTRTALLSNKDSSHTILVHTSVVEYYFPFFREDLKTGLFEFCVGDLDTISLDFLGMFLYGQNLTPIAQQLTPDKVLVLFNFFANERVKINPAKLLYFVSVVPHTPTQTAELLILTVKLHSYYSEIVELVPWLSSNQERVWDVMMNEALSKIKELEERKIVISLYHKFLNK